MSDAPGTNDLPEKLLKGRGSRREFLRTGAAAALAGGVLAACKPSAPAAAPAAQTPDSAAAAASQMSAAEEMDAMHEAGVKAFPAKTEGQGQPAHDAAMDGDEGLRPHRERDPVGGVARASASKPGPTTGRCPGPQIRVTRGRPGARRPQERAARIDRHPLPRRRGAQRSGRRAVHHAAADQAGRDLHLRVHRAATPARTCTTRTTTRPSRWAWACWAPSSSSRRQPRAIERCDIDYAMILNDGRARLHAQRQGLPGHRADRREARPEGAASAS